MAKQRKNSIKMHIHTGMLESLGVNMYTSVGQSLVEFIANAYDADAENVKVSMPFDDIFAARSMLRKLTKEQGLDIQQGVYLPLPDEVSISLADDGHGMTVEQMEAKFLSVSRNRRKEQSEKSESGRRLVMGRKGLGKLAGFGVAEEVIVISKRAGESYSVKISMDFKQISEKENIGDVEFTPEYEEGKPLDEQGTTIILRKLRCDSIKAAESTVEKTIARNFSHLGDDFVVSLNGAEIQAPTVHYEFIYPEKDLRNERDLGEFDVKTEDDFTYPILASVKFRARGASDNEFQRGHLAARDRGARVYCNGRLAAGPTLFDLPTGMHNFHSQSYMECIVEADVLDQMEIDLISTNRQGFKTDNVVVDAFVDTITELMKVAIREHGKYRDEQSIIEINADPQSKRILNQIKVLPKKIQKPAEQILRTLVAVDGTQGEMFDSVAPYFIQAINSSDVLVELIKSGMNPKDLKTVIGQLSELSDIERSDVLKLYRGRRSGIDALQKLEEQSHGKKLPQYEKDLHVLLKSNPWLIRPEYGYHLTSDAPLAEVARKLNNRLKIDDKGASNSNDRPDLVFVTIDASAPNTVVVVELKSPNIELDTDHLTQLEGYIAEVESILSQDYVGRSIKVIGYLIGNFPRPDTQATKRKTFLSKIKKSGANEQWEAISIPDLLNRARQTHLEIIEALNAEEEEDN